MGLSMNEDALQQSYYLVVLSPTVRVTGGQKERHSDNAPTELKDSWRLLSALFDLEEQWEVVL